MGAPGHPLLQTLVAFEIMKHLPRKDVLSCRLVCGVWDEEVCRLLRKRFTIEFDDLCQVNRFHALLDRSEEMKDTRDIPFARIHLRPSFRLGHSLAQQFFKNHGHVIRHLTILKVGCDCGANFFQKLLFYQAVNLSSLNLQIISSPIRLSPESGYGHRRAIQFQNPSSGIQLELPNLRHLQLRHQLFVERSPFIKELLMAVTNLESLTTDAASPEFISAVFLPIVLNCPNNWSKLKKISCGSFLTLSNVQIQELCKRQIQLEELCIHFNHSSASLEPIDKDSLLMLLSYNKETLKHLELNNRQAEVSFELDSIPKMPKLEYLRLTNVYLEPKWLEVLPRLLTFEFYEEERSGLCIPFTNLDMSPAYPPLSQLILSPMCIRNIRDLNDMALWWDVNGHLYIRKIAQAFPKLKCISLNGNDSIMRAIYEELPLLESLSIHGPITDEGVTGIQLDVCEMMHFEQSYHSVNFNVLPVAKFIGDLRRLRKLVIVPPLRSTLTEVSIFFGLVCCKDLTHLELNNPVLMKLWKEELERKRENDKPS